MTVLYWSLPSPAFAVDNISLILERIEFQDIVAEDVSITIDTDTADTVVLVISAARISLSASFVLERLEIRCENGLLTSMILSCAEGRYYAWHQQYGDINGRVAMEYRLDNRAGRVTLPDITIGKAEISGSLEFESGDWAADLRADSIELSTLRMLAEVFAFSPGDYAGESGTADIRLTMAGTSAGLQRIHAKLQAYSVGFYGANAAEQLSGRLSIDANATDGWQIKLDGNLDSGAVFIDSGINIGSIRPGIALEISQQPLRLAMDMNLDTLQQQVKVHQLNIDHPGVMTADIQVDAGLAAGITIHNAEVDLSVHEAGSFYTTYLQPFLLDTQFNNLEMSGAFKTGISINTTGLARLDLQAANIHTRDKSGRFNITGLNGELQVTDATVPIESSLTWEGADLYRLNFGPGKLVLQSSVQTVNIVNWDDVSILDGQLKINSLNISNPGRSDMTITLDGALTPVSMEDFTRSMGWPLMSGELTASIEGLTYSQGVLTVDGLINLGLFDGKVYIRNLRIENLFGLVPTLYTDIDIDLLDLELLTRRFTFGQIQGRLSGKVHRLELQAWQPLYFEAEFATPENDSTRHRISQKAVENLGYIGGGAGGALSGGLLRIFKNYSYGQIGISCRLYNGSCELGGVRTTPDGFIIVSRGGLFPPWIEVKGTGHSIKWVTLVDGLKTITTNQPEFD